MIHLICKIFGHEFPKVACWIPKEQNWFVLCKRCKKDLRPIDG